MEKRCRKRVRKYSCARWQRKRHLISRVRKDFPLRTKRGISHVLNALKIGFNDFPVEWYVKLNKPNCQQENELNKCFASYIQDFWLFYPYYFFIFSSFNKIDLILAMSRIQHICKNRSILKRIYNDFEENFAVSQFKNNVFIYKFNSLSDFFCLLEILFIEN